MTSSSLQLLFIILITVTNAFHFLPETTAQTAPTAPIAPSTVLQAVTASQVTQATASQVGKTLIQTVDQTCTRTQCYDKLASALGSNMESIIISETNNQASYLSNFVSTKFSSYAGPLVAVALQSPDIISNVKSNNNIAASGIVVGTITKYHVALQSFATCSAWTVTYMGPYSIIPGFGCSILTTMIADNQFNNIKNFLYGIPELQSNA